MYRGLFFIYIYICFFLPFIHYNAKKWPKCLSHNDFLVVQDELHFHFFDYISFFLTTFDPYNS